MDFKHYIMKTYLLFSHSCLYMQWYAAPHTLSPLWHYHLSLYKKCTVLSSVNAPTLSPSEWPHFHISLDEAELSRTNLVFTMQTCSVKWKSLLKSTFCFLCVCRLIMQREYGCGVLILRMKMLSGELWKQRQNIHVFIHVHKSSVTWLEFHHFISPDML